MCVVRTIPLLKVFYSYQSPYRCHQAIVRPEPGSAVVNTCFIFLAGLEALFLSKLVTFEIRRLLAIFSGDRNWECSVQGPS